MLEIIEPSVSDKLNLLLPYLGRVTEYPGQERPFDIKNDYSIICARNASEAKFFLDAIQAQGWITTDVDYEDKGTPLFTMTAAGWMEVERLRSSPLASSKAFIAMAFHPSRNPAREAIRTAVNAAGYLPIRIDEIEHVNHIDDEIIAQIRASKFLIADFTSQRNGVYFEAGFMLGLGRPVIWICDDDDMAQVHFDTRQYNTINYKDADDLATRLQFRIEAILGKGPHIPE